MKRKSLAEERPDLLPQWSPENEINPSEVSCGSHKKVLWICEKGHTWAATVKNRALIGSQCPYCEHRAVLKGYNDLKTVFPKVAKTWSPKNELKPTEVSSRSNIEVIWQCKYGHEWKARIADRVEGHGCPYCAGQRVWIGFNDLATTHPELIPEWSEKNTNISPDSITYKNRTNVWWHCRKCGNDYKAVVYARATGRICPFCIASKIKLLHEQNQIEKKLMQDFEYLLPQLATIYYAGNKGLKVLTDTEAVVGIPMTALVPAVGLAIDICSSRKLVLIKEYVCRTKSITYINIPGKLPSTETLEIVRKAFSDAHIYQDSSIEEDLKILQKKYLLWKKRASDSSSKA